MKNIKDKSPTKDKYDKEIDELMAIEPQRFGDKVKDNWFNVSPLFQFLTPSGQSTAPVGEKCYCPTMMKDRLTQGPTPLMRKTLELDVPKSIISAIEKSKLIPKHFSVIEQKREQLEEFAKIQRKADRVLQRKSKE